MNCFMAFENERFKVMKFGGTSMDDMEQVAQIEDQESTDAHTLFVVSAFSGVTDKLLALADEIMPFHNHPNKKKSDPSAFESFVQDTLQRIRGSVSNDAGGDLSHVEAFLRQYVENVLKIVPLYTEQQMFAVEDEKDLLKDVFRDRIISIGEVFSAHALSVVLTARSAVGDVYQDVDTANVISRPLNGINIHPVRGARKAELYREIATGLRGQVEPILLQGHTPVVPGYVGWIPGSITKTIDRGYTDSTAAILARGLDDTYGKAGSKVLLQIWKEVPGLFSGDPRLVEPGYNGKTFTTADSFQSARLRRTVTFREAAELSAGAGMKAINSNGILALHRSGVSLSVRNTYDKHDTGTEVLSNSAIAGKNALDESMRGIRFVSGKKGQTMFTVESEDMVAQDGVAANILDECRTLGVGVDAITTSATSLSFSVDSKDPNIQRLEGRLRRIGTVERQDNLALVCCIGNNLRGEVGLLAKISGILGENGINIEFDGGDKDSNLTFIVDQKDYEKAVKVLHDRLFEK
jgi:aspartate kinase